MKQSLQNTNLQAYFDGTQIVIPAGSKIGSNTIANTSEAFIKASDTIDDIADGANYKRLTNAERTQISAKGAYVGEIRLFNRSAVPTNFLALDASSLSLTDYLKLATALGHTAVAVGGSYALDAGVAFTTDFATDNRLDIVGHGLVDDDIIKISTSDALPSGLEQIKFYYVKKISDNEIEVALTSGGASIALSSNGSGTHKIHKAFTLADFRGEGIRGLDSGRGVDSGRALGSYQAFATEELGARINIAVAVSDQVRNDRITMPDWTAIRYCDAGTVTIGSGTQTTGTAIASLGTGETRMRNRSVILAICWEGIE